jgi:hypothetical protein
MITLNVPFRVILFIRLFNAMCKLFREPLHGPQESGFVLWGGETALQNKTRLLRSATGAEKSEKPAWGENGYSPNSE